MNVRISTGKETLDGLLVVPQSARTLVLFAHGSGSGRNSPRNRFVAQKLNEAGTATLLFDLLTHDEEAFDIQTAQYRFNIPFLAERLIQATRWARENKSTEDLRIGYLGASTGAAAALVAAAELGPTVGAVVSRGGRPDLAGRALARVQAPTLLIVGGEDDVVIGLNEQARVQMHCEVQLEIIAGATHLFEEEGALARVAQLAATWFFSKVTRV